MDHKTVDFLVEATSCEQFFLWKQFHTQMHWAQFSQGELMQAKKNNVSLTYAKIGDNIVCFWEAVSQRVDYEVVEKYLQERFKDVPTCDAMNFHQALHTIFPNGLPPAPVTDEDLRNLIIRAKEANQFSMLDRLEYANEVSKKHTFPPSL